MQKIKSRLKLIFATILFLLLLAVFFIVGSAWINSGTPVYRGTFVESQRGVMLYGHIC